MNFLLLISVLLPIIFDVVRSESGAFEISENWDCFVNLITRAEELEKYDINRHKPISAFMAFMHNYDMSVEAGTKIVFPVVKINVNGYYDAITGIFKAPVTGTYFIQLVLFTDTMLDEIDADLVTDNGNRVLGTLEFKTKNRRDRKSIYGMYDLDAGQEVWIRNGRNLAKYGQGALSVFSGFLAEIP